MIRKLLIAAEERRVGLQAPLPDGKYAASTRMKRLYDEAQLAYHLFLAVTWGKRPEVSYDQRQRELAIQYRLHRRALRRGDAAHALFMMETVSDE